MSQATTPTWDADLCTVLETQCGLLAELEPLAQRQGELIESGDTPALLELLGARQAIVDRFVATEQTLATLTEALPERLAALAGPQRDTLAQLMARVDEGLRAVADLDRRDGETLGGRRDEIAGELSSLGTAAAARRAYLGGASAPRFADRQG